MYLFDPSSSIIVMELLGAPNIILRHAIVKGEVFPQVAAHTGRFLATTLFHTSLLALDTHKFRWEAGEEKVERTGAVAVWWWPQVNVVPCEGKARGCLTPHTQLTDFCCCTRAHSTPFSSCCCCCCPIPPCPILLTHLTGSC